MTYCGQYHDTQLTVPGKEQGQYLDSCAFVHWTISCEKYQCEV